MGLKRQIQLQEVIKNEKKKKKKKSIAETTGASLILYHNNPKYWVRMAFANRVDPDQTL